MDNFDARNLPFLTRSMLDFNQSSQFGIDVDAWSSVAQPLQISGVTKSGTFNYQLLPTNNQVISSDSFQISDVPITISVSMPNHNAKSDICYAITYLTINGDRIAVLTSGYVSRNLTLNWPYGKQLGQFDGPGLAIGKAGFNQAAGAELNDNPGAEELWEILAITFQLVCDGTVATRQVRVQIDTGGGIISDITMPAGQTASQTVTYYLFPNAPLNNDSTNLIQTAPIPPGLKMNTNGIIQTTTTNLKAGDNYGPATYAVNLWLVALG